MNKTFLYLTKKEFATAWVEGGTIPVSLASKYRSLERDGIYTPDENIARKLTGVPEDKFKRIVDIDESKLGKGSSVNVNIGNFFEDDKLVGKDIEYKAKFVDGYILSFSHTASEEVMEKFKDKEVCLEIFNLQELEDEISSQLNIKGIIDKCKYTDGKDRDVFLKSVHDSWQDELRIYWEPVEADPKQQLSVNIKAGTGKVLFYKKGL